MTRHAEMERPDEVQELVRLTFPCDCPRPDQLGHRRPYSRLRERNVFDPTYRPRHMNHRAEGAAS